MPSAGVRAAPTACTLSSAWRSSSPSGRRKARVAKRVMNASAQACGGWPARQASSLPRSRTAPAAAALAAARRLEASAPESGARSERSMNSAWLRPGVVTSGTAMPGSRSARAAAYCSSESRHSRAGVSAALAQRSFGVERIGVAVDGAHAPGGQDAGEHPARRRLAPNGAPEGALEHHHTYCERSLGPYYASGVGGALASIERAVTRNQQAIDGNRAETEDLACPRSQGSPPPHPPRRRVGLSPMAHDWSQEVPGIARQTSSLGAVSWSQPDTGVDARDPTETSPHRGEVAESSRRVRGRRSSPIDATLDHGTRKSRP